MKPFARVVLEPAHGVIMTSATLRDGEGWDRALARSGETLLHLGRLEEGREALMRAAELVADVAGPDAADISRLRGQYNRLNANEKDAQQRFEEALVMLDQLAKTFSAYDGMPVG